MSQSASLQLLCPGLLGPVPSREEPPPAAPFLDRLLVRASGIPGQERSPEAALLTAAGLPPRLDRDAPFGRLALLADAPNQPLDGHWICATPVHLRPDRDQLLLFAGCEVDPDREEADALVASFNDHFRSDGVSLLAPVPVRWYLRSDTRLDLLTRPLSEVHGRSVADHLPSGADAPAWRRLENEAQMLFHASPVNRERERRGRPTINGLWLWGNGSLPALPERRPDRIVGDHPLTFGLARWLGIEHQRVSQWRPDESGRSELTLVYWDEAWTALVQHDLNRWRKALLQVDGWLRIAERLLRRGDIGSIVLDAVSGGRYPLDRGGLRRFWRRGGLESFLQWTASR